MPKVLPPNRIKKLSNRLIIYMREGYSTTVSLEDEEFVRKYTWYPNIIRKKKSSRAYAKCGSMELTKKYDTAHMHRMIAGAVYGDHVDHINCDTMDNRRSNLRIASNMENARNRHTKEHGVWFDRRRGHWTSYLWVNYVKRHIGCYSTKEDALAARIDFEKDIFGEFAPRR